MENSDFNCLLLVIMHNFCAGTLTFNWLHIGHFIAKHNKFATYHAWWQQMPLIPYNFFHFKTSLFIRRMSLINKVILLKKFVQKL